MRTTLFSHLLRLGAVRESFSIDTLVILPAAGELIMRSCCKAKASRRRSVIKLSDVLHLRINVLAETLAGSLLRVWSP